MFDVTFNRQRPRRGVQPSRRDFLRVGGLSALGLSLPQLLAAQAGADPGAAPKGRAKSVILVYLGGGLSHHDSFDLKPDAPAEIRGKYNPIRSSVPGLQVGELLPRMAQTMHKLTLVRSGAHNNDHHETATNWVLSGRFGSAFGDYPALGAVAAHEFGFHDVLPPYVAIPQNPSFTWELGKSAFLGGRYESFKTGDPQAANFKVQDVTPREPLPASRVERRESLLAAVDSLARRVQGNDQIATYDEFRQRATSMILSPEAQAAFAIGEEGPEALARPSTAAARSGKAVCWPGGWSSAACGSPQSTAAAGTIMPRSGTGWRRNCPSSTRPLRRWLTTWTSGASWPRRWSWPSANSAARRRSTKTRAATTGRPPPRCCLPAPASHAAS